MEGRKASATYPQDFKIEYVHNVTETKRILNRAANQTVVGGSAAS